MLSALDIIKTYYDVVVYVPIWSMTNFKERQLIYELGHAACRAVCIVARGSPDGWGWGDQWVYKGVLVLRVLLLLLPVSRHCGQDGMLYSLGFLLGYH